jgi:hypothetical protein
VPSRAKALAGRVNLSRLGKESGGKFDVFPAFRGDVLFLPPLIWTMQWL